jgi:hypothetical protein
MPGVYFDEREQRICVTAHAAKADLGRLAELLGVKEKLDAAFSRP